MSVLFPMAFMNLQMLKIGYVNYARFPKSGHIYLQYSVIYMHAYRHNLWHINCVEMGSFMYYANMCVHLYKYMSYNNHI